MVVFRLFRKPFSNNTAAGVHPAVDFMPVFGSPGL